MFEQGPVFRIDAASHVGLVRDLNEDSMISRDSLGLWTVADGMGGHAGGDFASQTIVAAIKAIPDDLQGAALMQAVRDAFHSAHHSIQQEAEARDGGTMGSTALSLILRQDHFVCLWVGDSRLYHCRDGAVRQLSSDHSLVNEWVEEGKLTREEAERHPHGNVITRAIGVGEVPEVAKIRGQYEPGDRFLLCSDGLSGYMDEADIFDVLANQPMEGIAERLVKGALDGGGRDNVTVIVVEVPW
ncbi:serine/threonine protein phosphatase [Amylibacter cionae]|uniref:Serine/threonine protein phosphatase n=2 Tax=Neptunicoccus cionae TaxID=2035344 RepID=A0A916QSS0_9RHOB|nr:serine/threonine protein phosphatase [Amylibacter cionae]